MEIKIKDSIEVKLTASEVDAGIKFLKETGLAGFAAPTPVQPVVAPVEEKVEIPVLALEGGPVVDTPAPVPNVNIKKITYSEPPYTAVEFGKFGVVNCTKHPVVIRANNGEVIALPPIGINTRIGFSYDEIDGNPFVFESKDGVVNCPRQQRGLLFIVSRIVFDALPERYDFIVPNTILANRDEKGNVNAVPNFVVHRNYEKVLEK